MPLAVVGPSARWLKTTEAENPGTTRGEDSVRSLGGLPGVLGLWTQWSTPLSPGPTASSCNHPTPLPDGSPHPRPGSGASLQVTAAGEAKKGRWRALSARPVPRTTTPLLPKTDAFSSFPEWGSCFSSWEKWLCHVGTWNPWTNRTEAQISWYQLGSLPTLSGHSWGLGFR